MIRCMNVNETRGLCKDRSRWCLLVSAYPIGQRREFIYLCMYRLDGKLQRKLRYLRIIFIDFTFCP